MAEHDFLVLVLIMLTFIYQHGVVVFVFLMEGLEETEKGASVDLQEI